MNEEEKKAIEYLKTRLHGNEGCKYIDVSQEDLRIFINLVDRKEKDIEGWKKYCEEIEEEQTEMSNKNCELEFEIEKLQKENEELRQDRNNNYQMIALAQNEALGYMQGYEDGKKLKRSAIANIVENQQYYIFNKQIEHYKEYIEKLKKENEKALAEYMEWQKQELGQKNKIIDLMANHIATSDSDLCEYLDITTKCKYYAGDNGKTCDNCIKQYFENKAKEIK